MLSFVSSADQNAAVYLYISQPMSFSRLIFISWFLYPKLVFFMVVGSWIRKWYHQQLSDRQADSIGSAIDPFSIQYFMIFSGALIVNHTALSSCFILTSSPVSSTWLLPYDLRTFHWLPSLALS